MGSRRANGDSSIARLVVSPLPARRAVVSTRATSSTRPPPVAARPGSVTTPCPSGATGKCRVAEAGVHGDGCWAISKKRLHYRRQISRVWTGWLPLLALVVGSEVVHQVEIMDVSITGVSLTTKKINDLIPLETSNKYPQYL